MDISTHLAHSLHPRSPFAKPITPQALFTYNVQLLAWIHLFVLEPQERLHRLIQCQRFIQEIKAEIKAEIKEDMGDVEESAIVDDYIRTVHSELSKHIDDITIEQLKRCLLDN